MMRDVAFAFADALKQQAEISTQAIALANSFIDSFKIDENALREDEKTIRNEDEIAAATKRFGFKEEDIEEFDPFRVTF